MTTVDIIFYIFLLVIAIVGLAINLIIQPSERTEEEEKELEQIYRDIPAFRFWIWISLLVVGLIFAIVYMITR